MSQGSQLGAQSTTGATTGAERKPHPMLRAFFETGPTPLIYAGPLAMAMKAELIEVDLDTGATTSAYEVGQEFTQGAGVIQGGIVSAMLDYAMALSGFTRIAHGKSFGTVSLTTQFLKPVMPGRHLAKGRLDRAGARMMFASAELYADGSSSLLATACAVMAITDLQR
jgi:acyl-coenzyme A thioesterase PaaI-like protein